MMTYAPYSTIYTGFTVLSGGITMKLFHKLLISVLAAVLIIFAVIGYFSYTENTKLLSYEIEQRAYALLDINTARLAEEIEDLQNIAVAIGVGYETFGPSNEENIKTLIKNALSTVPIAYGSALAFKPSDTAEGGGHFSPYYFRSGDRLQYRNLGTPEYNYPKQDWYKQPMISGMPLWSEPYIDVGGGETAMMTYSYPVRRNNVVQAIATADVSLRELTKLVDEIKVGTTGRAFLIGKDGMILAMPEDRWEFKRTVFDAAKELNKPELDAIGKDMTAGNRGFARMTDPLTKKDGWIVYGKVPPTGWSLAILVPKDELLAGVTELHRRMLIISGIGILLLIIVLYAINKTITKPLSDLANAAHHIAEGDYNVHLPSLTAKDEVGTLTRSFAEMKDSLLRNIDNLGQAQNIGGAAIEALPDAIVIMDAKWEVKHSNSAAKNFFSMPAEGSFLDFITTSFDSSLDRTQIGTVSRGTITFMLSRHEGDTSMPRAMSCSVTPIYSKSGGLTHYVMNAHNAQS